MTRSLLRSRLLIGASATALVVTANTADAQSLFRKSRSGNPAEQAAQAAAARATQNQAASTATRRTIEAFSRASAARQRMDAAQAAARAAAQAAQVSVPNGLGKGGLQVANGVSTDPSLWIGATGPIQATGSDGRTKVEVGQTQSKAILTWDSFNVGRETDLTFAQGGSDWQVLNRVTSATADPSKILGSIKAPGSVYIINRNGIVFGGASQVNVRSLVASSLDIHGGTIETTRPLDSAGNAISDSLWEQAKVAARNTRFVTGLLPGGLNTPITFSDYYVNDFSGTLPPVTTDRVVVEAGARLNAAPFGQVALFGHDVANAGTITTPDGQVMLAAGGDIYLDRGVDRISLQSAGGLGASGEIRGYLASSNRDGIVRNDGMMVADRGNVTLHARDVDQTGVIAVTTGIEAAGSIILDASTDLATVVPNGPAVGESGNFGDLTIGAGSHMSILPDGSDKTAVGNTFQPSTVELFGLNISFGDGSTLYAPGAAVYAALPFTSNQQVAGGRVYLGKGATIDVSGLGGVEIAMSQNEIRAELRANELRDNPVIRDGLLRGQTVYFDARLGGKLTDGSGVADLTGWYDLIPRGVDQFMTNAGSVTLQASEIITRAGSTIDLSGGSVRYRDGMVRRTRLIDEFGRLVPIEFADAKVKYVGVEGDFIVNHARWGIAERYTSIFSRRGAGTWQAGYDEGRSAGSLKIGNLGRDGGASGGLDQARIFDGTVRADVVQGQYQQDAPGDSGVTDIATAWRERPALASLQFSGLQNGNSPVGGNITIKDAGPRLGEDFAADSALFDYANGTTSVADGIVAYDHVLPANWFDGETFGKVALVAGFATRDTYAVNPDGILTPKPNQLPIGGKLTIGAGTTVDLGDFGAFSFIGRQAEIDGTIRAAGGSVRIEAVHAPELATNPNGSGQPLGFDLTPTAELPGAHLGATGVIDVAGKWSNALLEVRTGAALTSPVVDGGSVTIVGYNIALDKGSSIDVGGGAHLAANGGTPVLGDGGSIVLDNSQGQFSGGGTAVGAPTRGSIAVAGTLAGYAPGRGASLTIDTNDNVLIGGAPVLQDGILAAGVAAPVDVLLAKNTVLPAGSTLPFDAAYSAITAPPGATLSAGTDFFISSPLTVGADWPVVPGGYFSDDQGNVFFDGTIPAGTVITFAYGVFPAGYVFDAAVFPDGFAGFSAPANFIQPAGVINADFTIPAGFVVPKGAVLEQAVQVTPPKTYDTDFFTQGGFANYALSGANGMTVRSGTVVTPSVDILTLGPVAGIASGVRLSDLVGRAGSGVTLVDSATLPDALRPAMDLILSTVPTNIDGSFARQRITGNSGNSTVDLSRARSPGNATIETGAAIRMSAQSRFALNGVTDIAVDGTIDTPGGAIRIGGSTNDTNAIRIGDNARLTARGYQESRQTERLIVREVRDGGRITIGGGPGGQPGQYDNALAIAEGAVLDVSGVRGITDFTTGTSTSPLLARQESPLQAVTVDGNAGAIDIHATNGVIAGEMRLAAGGQRGRSGQLSIEQTGYRSLTVRQSSLADRAAVTLTSVIPETDLTLVADAIDGAGDLTLTVVSGGSISQSPGILFDGSVALDAARSITLDADRIQRSIDPGGAASAVTIIAPYVRMAGYTELANPQQSPVYAENLNGSFSVNAGLIDLEGLMAMDCTVTNCDVPGNGGFGQVLFRSAGDIRLISGGFFNSFSPFTRLGGFSSGGEIAFDAAQVYVTTGVAPLETGVPYDRTDLDPGFLVQAGERIVVRSNGAPAPVPLNFGARLTMRAPVIEQRGVVRAPAGQIRLEASDRLILAPGSLTSVSLEGVTVPFGNVAADAGLGLGPFLGYERADWTPTRSISLESAAVDLQAGSRVDLSGGGDLLGFTFRAGNGGTTNILADQSAAGAFAIVPSIGTAPAPAGTLADPRLTVGDTIWLGDVAGVKAGYYTLLPASYALLDGAVLVRPAEGAYGSPFETIRRDDGSYLTPGYRAVAGTPIRDAWSAFEVLDSATWRRYSEFTTISFNARKSQQAALAGLATRTLADAGGLRLTAQTSLDMAGTVDFSAAKGRAGTLDIVGTQIAVTGGAAPEAFLRVDAAQLAGLGAGSTLVGGSRPRTSFAGFDPNTRAPFGIPEGVALTTVATDVLVTAGTTLTLPELLLAATGSVTIDDGAVLRATGTTAADPSDLLLAGDGALVRLTSGTRVGTIRSDTTGASGQIRIGDGASLVTEGALSLNASQGFDLSRTAVLDVAGLDLASDRINLGDAPIDEPGATLAFATIQRLAASSDLLLRGSQSIDLFGNLVLGARDASGKATLAALTLDTALLQGHAAAGDLPTLTVGVLTVTNSGAAAGEPAIGTGMLRLDVDTLALGPGDTAIGGYAGVVGTVGAITTTGDGSFNLAGDLALATGRVSAGTGSEYALTSTGTMALTRGVAPMTSPVATLGGNFVLSGSALTINTDIAANAGSVALTATAGDLAIGDGAVIDVSGRAIDFRDTVKFAPGGVVRLTAGGNVVLAEDTIINVSADARGGGAGMVEVRAGDRAALLGDLRAAAADGFTGGEFLVDAGRTDFADLNDRLNAGGFDAARDIRLRQDIVLGAGESIIAHRIGLHSDGGTVRIAGLIDASGDAAHPSGGTVRLTGTQVMLDAGGRIDASAGSAMEGGYAPASGNVELAGDVVILAGGSTIDVSGGRQGGGRLMVRADREGTGVAATLATTVTGAREKTLVGTADYASDTVDAQAVTTAFDDANIWLAGAAGPAGWDVGAGIAFASAADLTVATDIDLAAIDGAGYLGLTAAGDIRIDGAISDGFSSANADAALQNERSFSYDFEAGGDVVIGGGRIVRTGTGDIRVAAARDLVLTDAGSVVYTAGRATATAEGFDRTGFGPVKTGDVLALGEFPTLGGDLALSAGRDIVAPIVTQSASAWLFRYGQSTWNGNPDETSVISQTSWSIMYGNFQSGVGALGGGDVRVRAGRDIWDLGIAIPSTGHLTTRVESRPRIEDLIVRGGGDLDLRTGGDLRGGFFVMGRGHAELIAGGDIGQGQLTQVVTGNVFEASPLTESRGLNPLFGLMDADVRVTAGGDVAVEGAYDLTNVAQVCGNFSGSCGGGGTGFVFAEGNDFGIPGGEPVQPGDLELCTTPGTCLAVPASKPPVGAAFVGYTGRAGLDMIAVGGDATYINNGYAGTSVSLQNPDEAFQIRPSRPPSSELSPVSVVTAAQVAPGTLRVAALSGDIAMTPLLDGGLTLAPAPRGTLALLAAGEIRLDYDTQRPIELLDVGAAYIRGALAPVETDGFSTIDIISAIRSDPNATVGNNRYRGYTPLHLGDPEPVRIVALDGSIYGEGTFDVINWTLVSPKPVDIFAGQDVSYAVLQVQHNDINSVSRIVAGRDILHRNTQFGYNVLGEGLLWVEAGRNYNSFGSIVSAGNGASGSNTVALGKGASSGIGNLALPDRGADIALVAGTAQGSDYDGFANLYLDPANLADPAFPLSHPNNVGKVVRTYETELDQYLAAMGVEGITPENRLQLFAALSSERRGVFLQDVIAGELQQTGIDYNDAGGPRFQQYNRGYDALRRLFPATAELEGRDNPLGGDIVMNGGPVESRSGGDIQIIAPYGRIGVGNPASDQPIGAFSATGVVTRRGGNVDMIANGTISLDLSRVFTLQGGDLLMWTSFGDITAGAGAKTSITNVPLSFQQDRFGEVAIDAFGLSTGAGIGVLDALQGGDADRQPSRLDLLAFFGEVNAGDAGIRVVGDLNIAALSVVNAANIEVSGEATGIPVTAQVNTGALTAASAATSAVVNEAARLAERARPKPVQDLPTILNVRFVGFGEE